MKTNAPIEREPKCPPLGPVLIELLTQLCFGEQDDLDRPAESIMIFGTSRPESQDACAEEFRRIQRCLNSREVFVTGGCVKTQTPESEEILRKLDPARYPEARFISESASTSTIENVIGAIDLGLAKNEDVVFMAAAHHCGRCRLTLMKYAPHMKIRQHGYVPRLDGQPALITAFAWHHVPLYRSHVWGEYLRIRQYGQEGKIAYPPEVRILVRRIELFMTGH